jgi:Sugar (and other) transporter
MVSCDGTVRAGITGSCYHGGGRNKSSVQSDRCCRFSAYSGRSRVFALQICIDCNRLSPGFSQASIEEYTFLIFVVFSVTFVFFTYFNVIETKGKSMEEIQRELRSGKGPSTSDVHGLEADKGISLQTL